MTQQSPGGITVFDENRNWIHIPRLEANEAQRTLRVWLAPDGNWKTELTYLILVSSDWKVWMVAGWLTPFDTAFSLKHVVLQKLMYPLTTTTFT